MKDLYDILNLGNVPLENKIKLAIAETKIVLRKVPTIRNCAKYSRVLYTNLNQSHVVSKIINTKDIGASYEHYFVLVPINGIEYYLLDLTYNQFNNEEYFKNLYSNGYERITDFNFSAYYSIVTNEFTNKSLNEVFSQRLMRR